MCRDAAGPRVAVEIKRRGEIDGVEQLTRYLELLNRDPLLAPVRGIFAAQEIKPQARVLATDRGIACAVVDYDALRGIDDRRAPALLTPRVACAAWRAPPGSSMRARLARRVAPERQTAARRAGFSTARRTTGRRSSAPRARRRIELRHSAPRGATTRRRVAGSARPACSAARIVGARRRASAATTVAGPPRRPVRCRRHAGTSGRGACGPVPGDASAPSTPTSVPTSPRA